MEWTMLDGTIKDRDVFMKELLTDLRRQLPYYEEKRINKSTTHPDTHNFKESVK